MMMWPGMMGGLFSGEGLVLMIFIFIFTAAVITGIILLIVWLVKRVNYPAENFKAEERNALEILKERYARGEITKTEFEKIKKDIT